MEGVELAIKKRSTSPSGNVVKEYISCLVAIEFLGHKERLIPFIFPIIERVVPIPSDVVDLFSGTAAVSTEFKKRGWRVVANDNLVWCSIFSEAVLLNNGEPTFGRVLQTFNHSIIRSLFNTPYDVVLDYLNSVEPIDGFMYKNYSPASRNYCDYTRMYFTEENARLIDAIRTKIGEWDSLLSRGERAILLCDLIRAVNAISNVAGTYGCYLKQWKPRARQRLKLKRARIVTGPKLEHRVLCDDANEIAPSLTSAVSYADPPYTKRQYAAYYHILETIAIGDDPEISGATGLRPWKGKSSDYCYKEKAPQALEDLVSKLRCRHFFLSYNEDGQIPHKRIMLILSKYGSVTFHEAANRRYKSSLLPHKGTRVLERLYHVSLNENLE